MRCESCEKEVVVYELYPRSYRLYAYLCNNCRKGFLAHHFDLNLEIYQMEDLAMKQNGKLLFITGLKVEPRVFDFNLGKNVDTIIVADDEMALGELAKPKDYIFAPYSDKAMRRIRRLLRLSKETSVKEVTEKVSQSWEKSK
jgi:hypothetical protein